jgi:uncharacterized protein (DUF486 family)
MTGVMMQFALFMQTTKDLEDTSFMNKLVTSEFWATLEWFFVIPSQRLGYLFLNPIQLNLSSYIFNFLSQIWANNFWLKIPTTIDDYSGMVLILIGMYVAKMRVFG